MPVSYLICAAGQGRRTKEISNIIPKPLLRLKGKSFLRWSLESLPLQESDYVHILYSPEMSEKQIHESLDGFPKIEKVSLFPVLQQTRGQLETAMLAFPYLNPRASICIYNSDTFFSCQNFLDSMQSQKWEGLIPCCVQPGDSWSFCQISSKGSLVSEVLKVTEKLRISDWCSVGAYWFRDLKVLHEMAKTEICEKAAGQEVYVAPLYNRYIQSKFKIGMIECEDFRPMGSLEQIQNYWGLSLEEIKKENI